MNIKKLSHLIFCKFLRIILPVTFLMEENESMLVGIKFTSISSHQNAALNSLNKSIEVFQKEKGKKDQSIFL